MKQCRINDPAAIDADSVVAQIAAGSRVIVQYSKPGYDSQQLASLNALAKVHGQNLEIRFYGHYSMVFDASVLSSIPDAQSLSIDCLMDASNLDAISHIRSLKELSLGVYRLEDNKILTRCNLASLESLSLGDTKSGGIDLATLANCRALARLHTTGHTKNITTIRLLPTLGELSLSRIERKHDLSFVSDMPQLISLRVLLGGRASLANVTPTNLETLEIIRVQGLEDLGALGRFKKLERVLIEDQIKLRSVALGPNPELHEIRIVNCKSLESITGLSTLESLSHMRIYRTAMSYASFIQGDMPKSLTTLAFYTAKSKHDAEIQADLTTRGFREFAEA